MDSGKTIDQTSELALIQAVIAGEKGAWDRFLQRYSDSIYTICKSVVDEKDVGREYLAVVQAIAADGAASLEQFNGQGSFARFLTNKVREILAGRILVLFKDAPDLAWLAFQRYLREAFTSIRNKLHNKIKDVEKVRDLCQDICVHLVENHYHRILSFKGTGNFSGFVCRIINNFCIDRLIKQVGKLHLPEAVERMGLLEQKIYREIHLRRRKENELPYVLRGHTDSEFQQALDRLGDYAVPKPPHMIIEEPLVVTDETGKEIWDHAVEPQTPESILENAQTKSAIDEAKGKLADHLKLYLKLKYRGKKPREIAVIMGREVKEIYRMHEELKKALLPVLQKK